MLAQWVYDMYYESLITTVVCVVTAVLSAGVLIAPSGIEVTGPITYSMYVVGSRTFLLFGDSHFYKTGGCAGKSPTITDWLLRVLSASKNMIDVFIEMHKDVHSPDTGFLGDVSRELSDCVDPSKCDLPNARIHYVDIRIDSKGPLVQYFIMFLKLAFPDLDVHTGRIPEIPELVTILRRSHDDSKTAKQLSMIRDPGIADAITKVYDELQAEIVQGSAPDMAKFLMLLSLEMDIYALGRMFKTTKDGKTTTRNIVYAGRAHIDNYARFLGSVGRRVCGQSQREGPDGPVRCVQLDGRVLTAFS